MASIAFQCDLWGYILVSKALYWTSIGSSLAFADLIRAVFVVVVVVFESEKKKSHNNSLSHRTLWKESEMYFLDCNNVTWKWQAMSLKRLQGWKHIRVIAISLPLCAFTGILQYSIIFDYSTKNSHPLTPPSVCLRPHHLVCPHYFKSCRKNTRKYRNILRSLFVISIKVVGKKIYLFCSQQQSDMKQKSGKCIQGHSWVKHQ